MNILPCYICGARWDKTRMFAVMPLSILVNGKPISENPQEFQKCCESCYDHFHGLKCDTCKQKKHNFSIVGSNNYGNRDKRFNICIDCEQ